LLTMKRTITSALVFTSVTDSNNFSLRKPVSVEDLSAFFLRLYSPLLQERERVRFYKSAVSIKVLKLHNCEAFLF
jgi:hypothetical protein